MANKQVTDQPVSDIQLNQLQVEWVPRDSVKPNKYNPNKMTWHDRMLLRQSLLEDGWTQPIVTLPDGTIVDGEQRWTTAGIELSPEDIQEVIDRMYRRAEEGAVLSESIVARLEESKRRLEAAIAEGKPGNIAAITGGLVPITRVDFRDDAHKMISTIRHNRARGTHKLDSMSEITADLVALGLDFNDLETRLGMDDDEIQRLLDSAEGLSQAEALLDRTEGDFSNAWEPVHIAELEEDDEVMAELERSRAAAEAQKQHQLELAKRAAQIDQQTKAAIEQHEAETGTSLTQDEKEKIERRVEKEMPKLPAPERPVLKKFAVFVLPDEYDIIIDALGPEDRAARLVEICRDVLAGNFPVGD